MTDRITILRHSHNRLAKLWRADGTIQPYDDAKRYTLSEIQVSSIGDLSVVLDKLQGQPKSCVIRGKYVGAELAAQRDPDFDPRLVKRQLDYFDDQPLHSVLIDVDAFTPIMSDPLEDPEEAIAEFIFTALPAAFHGAGYHWQLSNSFAHPTALAKGLKVHLWFWLERKLTSAQLKAWAASTALAADRALFNPVQVHYTAAPMFENGCTDPVVRRSGFVPGAAVPVDVSDEVLAAATRSGGSGQRLLDIAETDPVALVLAERSMIKSQTRDGFNIVCPFEDGHSTESVETATQYMLPNTGGYVHGHFRCRHASCTDRTRGMFLARLGIDEVVDDFDVAPMPTAKRDGIGAGDGAAGPADGAPVEGSEDEPRVAPARKGIPEAKHLVTDQANAGRIVRKFGKRLIVSAGQWYTWTGKRWEQDDGEVYRYACNLSRLIHAEADAMAAEPFSTEEEAKQRENIVTALRTWAKKSEMKREIEAAVGLAKKMLVVDEAQLNRDPWALNCANGTVDLRTGRLRPHNTSDYITKLVQIDYDPDARAPLWEGVLAKVTLEEGLTSRPLASFLQRWFGYCATGSTREQQFVVHYGQGSNGKSTVLDLITDVLGEYAGTAAPGLLVSSGKDRHPTEIADLFSRRMVTAHETGEGGVLREDFIKQATGGDKLKARFMRADFFDFSPTHKLQLLTNHKPIIKGQDKGIWRRVLLMPYMARFGTGEEIQSGRAHYLKDTRIGERLAAEKAGVLTWVVAGSRSWFQDGLQPPDQVLAASRDYQTEQDRMGQFVAECCEIGKDLEAELTGSEWSSGLYQAYRSWCSDNGTLPLGKNRMVQELERCVPFFAKFERKVAIEGAQSDKKRRVATLLRGLSLLAE